MTLGQYGRLEYQLSTGAFIFAVLCLLIFAPCVLAKPDIDDLADRVADLEIRPRSVADDVNSVIIDMGIPRQIELMRDSIYEIKEVISGGRSDLKHLIKQLELDHELIVKNTDGILLLDNRVLVLEQMVPENKRRIISIENKEKKQDEAVKKLFVSVLTSTAGIISGIAIFLISIIKVALSYRTNKKNQELLERIAGAQGERS